MRDGECDKVITFFDEQITFYFNSRDYPSLDHILEGCRQIPRFFPEEETVLDKFYILSENTAYNLHVVDFDPIQIQADGMVLEVLHTCGTKQTAAAHCSHACIH